MVANERATGSAASPSPNTEEPGVTSGSGSVKIIVEEDDDLDDTATSKVPSEENPLSGHPIPDNSSEVIIETITSENDSRPPEWVEWREDIDSLELSDADKPSVLPNGELKIDVEGKFRDTNRGTDDPSPLRDHRKIDEGVSQDQKEDEEKSESSQLSEKRDETSGPVVSVDEVVASIQECLQTANREGILETMEE